MSNIYIPRSEQQLRPWKTVNYEDQIMSKEKWRLLCVLVFKYFQFAPRAVLKIGENHSDIPRFSLGLWDQLRAREISDGL